MSYIDARIDRRIAYGFQGGPEWLTQIVNMDNGREQRNAQWLYPRQRYTAHYLNFSAVDRTAILAVFYAARGRLHAFRFRDPLDNAATSEAIAPAVGTTTAVQLIKTYSFGGQAVTRLIQAPVAGSVVVYIGGATPVAGTLDQTTGLFTPTAAWAAGTFTWTGSFDVWVRFDNDHNAFSIDELDAANADISLIEVRR
jgi:uncharacterized protein (TIGR02217 family)